MAQEYFNYNNNYKFKINDYCKPTGSYAGLGVKVFTILAKSQLY